MADKLCWDEECYSSLNRFDGDYARDTQLPTSRNNPLWARQRYNGRPLVWERMGR